MKLFWHGSGNDTVHSIELDINGLTVEAEPCDCQILATSQEALPLTDIKDNRNSSSFIAISIIVAASLKHRLGLHSVSGFPEHVNSLVLCDWLIANPARESVVAMAVYPLIGINLELKVQERTGDLCVDEGFFFGLQVPDQMHDVFSVKVNFSHTVKIHDLWSDVMQNW